MPSIAFKSGAVRLQASAGKTPSVDIVAYNGGIMAVEEIGNCVVDLGGLEIPPSIPLAVDHNLSIDTTIGNGRAAVDAGRRLLVAGLIASDNAAAKHVLELNRIKTPLQASISVEFRDSDTRFVHAGQTVNANGRVITADRGGFLYIPKSRLIETSIVTKGADDTTSVSIAASRVQGATMNFDEYVTGLGFDPATLTEQQRAALQVSFDAEHGGGGTATMTASAIQTSRTLQATEARRVAQIHHVAGGFPMIVAHAIEKGWSPAETELAVLKANRPTGPSNHPASDSLNDDHIIQASLLQALGVSEKFLGKHYDQRTLNAAMSKDRRGMTLHGVINHTLRAAGKATGWRKVNNETIGEAFTADRVLKAAASGGSLTGILGNTAGKLLLDAYQQIPTTWRLFAGIQSAKDFKAFTSYMFTVKGELEELGPNGELKHVTMQESEYANRLKTRGKMIELNRTDIINDDLGAFASVPKVFGRMGAVGTEKAVYKCLMSNLATIFSVGHLNYFEGADSALSITSLGTAEQKFLSQLDENGDPMLLLPTLLGVPAALSAKAATVASDTSTQHPADIEGPESTKNPHGGKFTPFVSPWLDNPNMTGAAAEHWFLFAPPVGNQGIVNIAFLDGQQNPTVEEGEVSFDRLGAAWRMFFDFGVAVGDYRFGVRSKGKA